MTDRLTQLQQCLGQIVDQFGSAINYVDRNHDFEPHNEFEEKLSDPQAAIATPEDFERNIDELTTDMILKTRQIIKLINSLPGFDVSAEEQLRRIDVLQEQLMKVEEEKLEAVKRKEELLRNTNELITEFTEGIANSRRPDKAS